MVRRVVLGVAGALLLIGGIAVGGLAGWASVVFGPDGELRVAAGTITPAPGTIATVIDVDRFGATVEYVGGLGRTRLSASTGDAGDVSDTLFLGAGPTSAVDGYLRGSAYSVALRADDQWTVREVPGVSVPPLPREQDLWITADVGRRPSIEVPEDRPLTLVLMHPAAIPSGPLVLTVDVSVPDLTTWVRWLVVGAAALLGIGVLLLVLALRRPRGPGRHRAGAEPTPEQTPGADPGADPRGGGER